MKTIIPVVFVLTAIFSVTVSVPIDSTIIGILQAESDFDETSTNARHNTTNDVISIDIGYSMSTNLRADWSRRASFESEDKEYYLLDYTDYAVLFDKFITLYPTVVIYTTGTVKSGSTFGDVGKFGELVYPTKLLFPVEGTHYAVIVAEDDDAFGYSVTARVGVGFKKHGTKLYLKPYVYGSLLSHGAYTRSLDISFAITKIRFSPNTNSLHEIMSNDDYEENM